MANGKVTVSVVIGKDGGVKIENVCGAGGKCEEVTASLEQRLGGKATGRQHTDEYFKVQECGNHVTAGG